MTGRDIIVMGASAGGVEALSEVVRGLPGDLPASVFVVLHISDTGSSVLPTILSRHGALPAAHPQDGDPIETGVVYVAPPGRHLLLKRGRIRVVYGPRENGTRPAIDPLFRTAARAFGPRVIGVVLSGGLDDGSAGLAEVKRYGGVAVVVDPDTVGFSDMPRNAIQNVDVDHVVPLPEIAPLLVKLVGEQLEEVVAPMEEEEEEADSTETDAAIEGRPMPGTPSGFTCPECGGGMWEMEDRELVRFQCRVGHAYSPDTLLAEQGKSLEGALWVAMRSLEETASLLSRLSGRMGKRGAPRTASKFQARAAEARARAALVRQALLSREIVPEMGEVGDELDSTGLSENGEEEDARVIGT